MEHLLVVLLVLVVAFILVSRFVEDATARLVFQVVLAAVLVWYVLTWAGVA